MLYAVGSSSVARSFLVFILAYLTFVLSADAQTASATLAWNWSISPGVNTYQVCYGPASGTYTNSIWVGNTNTAVISGLVPGATYYFTVIARNTAGVESLPCNEVIHSPTLARPPGLVLQLTLNPVKQPVVRGYGTAGKVYELQISSDLQNWTALATRMGGVDGTVEFTDSKGSNLTKRYYRLREL